MIAAEATTFLSKNVRIPVGEISLEGTLVLPALTRSVVLFSQGGSNNRPSLRNNYVANVLTQAGIGTLLFDLLTPSEAADYEMQLDVSVLTKRLSIATDWLCSLPLAHHFKIGYFGLGVGAVAALQAAAQQRNRIAAVISHNARFDVESADFLSQVLAPTLLIVGGVDEDLVALNQEAFRIMKYKKELKFIPGTIRSLEEPETLELVAHYIKNWFNKNLDNKPTPVRNLSPVF